MGDQNFQLSTSIGGSGAGAMWSLTQYIYIYIYFGEGLMSSTPSKVLSKLREYAVLQRKSTCMLFFVVMGVLSSSLDIFPFHLSTRRA